MGRPKNFSTTIMSVTLSLVCLWFAVGCGAGASSKNAVDKSAMPMYLVTKQTTDKLGVAIDVEIPKQYSKADMIAISTELRKSIPANLRVRFDFWLKGQAIRKETSYAYIFYPSDENVKRRLTEKDNSGLRIKFELTGQ